MLGELFKSYNINVVIGQWKQTIWYNYSILCRYEKHKKLSDYKVGQIYILNKINIVVYCKNNTNVISTIYILHSHIYMTRVTYRVQTLN